MIEVAGLEKEYGDKLLFKDLSFKLPPGGIVGVIGPNGAGKSTLVKIVTGQEKADAGAVRLGETVKLAAIMANNFFAAAVALASIYAILKLSSGV